ncbi:hypothetical protein [Colwellia echini]|uniref:GreA/GreB family elongation factor n=1 Tax=Colwellia echini TaxID=1982103 RepID=A0ABY3MSY7_9GAMM|nr:hypothetical protein [Colwellia echini]TYK64257.1 GreA/GreB family elongation factor [Colwellia echini]
MTLSVASTPNKKQLIQLILIALEKELQQAINAANEAHAAAVDDQSVAETQYDTLAIEASYLAEGQSRRVTEFQNSIDAFKKLDEFLASKALTYIDKHSSTELRAVCALGSLVQLAADEKANHWFFMAPAAGGFRCELAQQKITVITPKSPMGMAIIGKQPDDDIEVMLGANKLEDYIAALK